MIEFNLLVKGDYIFKWENIPKNNIDDNNLKKYLIQKFTKLEWIKNQQFVKVADEKTIYIENVQTNQSLSISIDVKTFFASLSINGNSFCNEFILKRGEDDNIVKLNVYERDKDILSVWFNAWKYEDEKYLAVVPFLRTIKITLDNDRDSKNESWDNVRKALDATFQAFVGSTNINLGFGSYVSTQTDLSKFTDLLRADGSAKVEGETVYYHKHVTEYLEDSLSKLRQNNNNRKIVVFMDDLDRCHPKQALEVLDSIKTFFDIEGIVYVIGMDADSINAIVEEKYGNGNKDSNIKVKKGYDYLQKIVQLPFKIPEWQAIDISSSMDKIISKGLEGSELLEDFKKYKELIVRAVEHNPREVKRFINTVILAQSVIIGEVHIDKLIAYQSLAYRPEWNTFLQLIIPYEARKRFLNIYDKLKDKFRDVANDEQLTKLSNALPDESDQKSFKENIQIYSELIKHGNKLLEFLKPDAIAILNRIENMEKYRRAFDVTKIKPKDLKQNETNPTYLLGLLHEGKIKQFNEIVSESNVSSIDFSNAFMDISLSGANLIGANLSSANLSSANLSSANLSGAKLFNGKLSYATFYFANLTDSMLFNANLSGANLTDAKLLSANLSGANLTDANLSSANLTDANLSSANLSSANLSSANLSSANLSSANLSSANLSSANLSGAILLTLYDSNIKKLIINEDTSFSNAISDSPEILDYLENKIQKENMPFLFSKKEDLKEECKNEATLMNGLTL